MLCIFPVSVLWSWVKCSSLEFLVGKESWTERWNSGAYRRIGHILPLYGNGWQNWIVRAHFVNSMATHDFVQIECSYLPVKFHDATGKSVSK